MAQPKPSEKAAAQARWRKAFRSLETSLPPSRPASAAERRRVCSKLDSEFDGMSMALIALKAKRNSFALVSSLPPEVLANIFALLPQLYQSFFTRHYSIGRGQINTVYGWINVTHVCRHWRTVALNWPSLWCNLDQAKESYPVWEIFLERAKSAPISIYKPMSDKLLAYIPSILSHQHHIGQLRLENIPVEHMQEIISGLAGPLPQLRMLALSSSQPTGQLAPMMHTQLLSDIAPRLGRLTLENITFPWGTGSPTLVELTISRSDDSPPHNLDTFSDIVCTLRQMPALTHLKLVNQLSTPTLITEIDAIHLPHLQTLHLRNKGPECWHLWSMIDAPTVTTIDVRASNDRIGTLVPSILKAQLVKLPAPFIRVEMFVWSREMLYDPLDKFAEANTLSLNLLVNEESPLLPRYPEGWHRYVDPQREMSLKIGTTDPLRLATRLLSVMGSGAIKTLDLGGLSGDVASFYDIFLPMRAVEVLTVRTDDDAGAILVALTRSSMNNHDTLLPLLRTLTFDHVDFTTRISHLDRSISVENALEGMLQSRQDKDGKSLEALNFLYCPYAYPLDTNRHWLSYASYTEVQPDYD